MQCLKNSLKDAQKPVEPSTVSFFQAIDLVQLQIIKRILLGELYPLSEAVTGNEIKSYMPVRRLTATRTPEKLTVRFQDYQRPVKNPYTSCNRAQGYGRRTYRRSQYIY